MSECWSKLNSLTASYSVCIYCDTQVRGDTCTCSTSTGLTGVSCMTGVCDSTTCAASGKTCRQAYCDKCSSCELGLSIYYLVCIPLFHSCQNKTLF